MHVLGPPDLWWHFSSGSCLEIWFWGALLIFVGWRQFNDSQLSPLFNLKYAFYAFLLYAIFTYFFDYNLNGFLKNYIHHSLNKNPVWNKVHFSKHMFHRLKYMILLRINYMLSQKLISLFPGSFYKCFWRLSILIRMWQVRWTLKIRKYTCL